MDRRSLLRSLAGIAAVTSVGVMPKGLIDKFPDNNLKMSIDEYNRLCDFYLGEFTMMEYPVPVRYCGKQLDEYSYDEWRGPCVTMDKKVFTDPEVIKLSRNVITMRLDLMNYGTIA